MQNEINFKIQLQKSYKIVIAKTKLLFNVGTYIF